MKKMVAVIVTMMIVLGVLLVGPVIDIDVNRGATMETVMNPLLKAVVETLFEVLLEALVELLVEPVAEPRF